MATSLDMPLDARIKNRSARIRGRGQGRAQGRGRGVFRGRGTGMLRQGSLSVINRPSPYKIAKSFSRTKESIWKHDLFNDSMTAVGLSGIETGTKLYISNLHYGVSNEDIRELFSACGDLKHSTLHYDRDGRPSGSAEVIFVRKSSALEALRRYNNVSLDGKPMKIEVIGTNLGLPISPRISVVDGANGRGRRTVVMTPRLGQVGSGSSNRVSGRNRGGMQQGRGRGRGGGQIQVRDSGRGRGWGRGHGRGRGRKRNDQKSAEELDKDLDSYYSEAMKS